MMKKILNMIDSGDDEPLEFSERYEDPIKAKIKERRDHHKDKKLYDKWIHNNKIIIDELKEQKNRASSMEYFDSIYSSDKILQRLKREKAKGKKIIGTFCNLVPFELIHAAGAIPVRLCSGFYEAVNPAEETFPRDSCSLIKASLGFAISDQPFYSLCDAIVIPTSCDGKKKLADILNNYKPVWVLDMPQSKERTNSKKYWLSETRILKKRLEDLTKKKIGKKDLKEAIETYQRRYEALRRLMDIRKSKTAVISGRDSLLVMEAAGYDDIHIYTKKVNDLCAELEQNIENKKSIKDDRVLRILVTGSPIIMPNFKIPNLIESFDANIAIDMTCTGSQQAYDPVVVEEWNMQDMLSAVSEKYLMPSVCPCFVKSEDRIDKLMDMIEEYKIDAVIYHTLRLCLLFDVESFKVRDILESKKIPYLSVNTDYSTEDREQLRTRIEAFLEIVSAHKDG